MAKDDSTSNSDKSLIWRRFEPFEVVAEQHAHGQRLVVAVRGAPIHLADSVLDRRLETKAGPANDLSSQDLSGGVDIDKDLDRRRNAEPFCSFGVKRLYSAIWNRRLKAFFRRVWLCFDA